MFSKTNKPSPQVYPFGQQWTPSEQQTAFGNGQQPYSPDANLQHVFPLGHSDWPSGHVTLFKEIALVFNKALITSLPLEQEPVNVKNATFN